MTNTSTLIIQLKLSALEEILLESKVTTDVFLFSGKGFSVTPETRIPKKGI